MTKCTICIFSGWKWRRSEINGLRLCVHLPSCV